MGIFGFKKGRASSVSSQPSQQPQQDRLPHYKKTKDASDVLGDSPTFGAKEKVGTPTSPSQVPSYPQSAATGAAARSRTPSNNVFRKLSGANRTGSQTSNNRASMSTDNVASARTSTTGHNLSNAPSSFSLAESAKSTTSSAADSGRPRPSDLFAGRGSKWGDSVGSGAAPAAQEDMQSFLKARRQWVPTFKTEDDVASGNDQTSAPKRLEDVSFAGSSLMSLKDLEESHKRKQKLLGELPLGGDPSLFDSSSVTDSRASSVASGSNGYKAAKTAPQYPARTQSFRSSSTPFGTSQTSLPGQAAADAAATASSSQATESPKDPLSASTTTAAAASSRDSTDSERGAKFDTPGGSDIGDDDHAAADATAALPSLSDRSVDPEAPESLSAADTVPEPRTPTRANLLLAPEEDRVPGDRTPTPTARFQTSQDAAAAATAESTEIAAPAS